MADFKPAFRKKLQDFFKANCVPVELKKLKNRCVRACVLHSQSKVFASALCSDPRRSLSIRSWSDGLLASVLRGQNLSGVLKKTGKKDVLSEPIAAVLLRTEVLQQRQRYRNSWRSGEEATATPSGYV